MTGTNDTAAIDVSQPCVLVKKYSAQNPAISGIQASLTKVQKDEHPCRLSPVQSSEDARDPRDRRQQERSLRIATTQVDDHDL